MWDTGLRNRFFFIILATLILAAVGINLVHVKFFKSQRLKLIDRQISESSSALLDSEEFKQAVAQPETIDDTISKVLRGTRIGKVFVLRDETSQIIFQSFSVGLLEAELPVKPEWVGFETETEYVRLRNILVPGTPNRVLQVGLVLNRNFLDWKIIDHRFINYMLGILISTFMASVLLTLILLSPLRLLIVHLNQATSSLVNLNDVQPLPMRLRRYSSGFWARSDEFSNLLGTVQKLIDRINLNYKLTRSWTLQMAHELKTPLAIIRAETAAKKKAQLLPDQFAADIVKEVEQMSGIINQFLEWAELESSLPQRDLHALRVRNVVNSVAARLDKISQGRIQIDIQSEFSIFASPNHLNQLITNLLTNALKFSPADKKVEITVANKCLRVRDYGPGIPLEVRERLGQPFNVGESTGSAAAGHGLGLAWVLTVTKLYQWVLDVKSGSEGTEMIVYFKSAIEA